MSDRHPSCTVGDLLAEKHLGLVLATPGVDLGRPVRWVQTTELLDPSPYLRPDELVCTVGTSLTTDEAVAGFVASVAAQASAVCFGLGDVHDAVPPRLVTACAAAGLALLTLPYGVPFLAVADVAESRRGRAADARSLGGLVDLVRSRLAQPASLAPALATRTLDPARLVVACWPAGSGPVLSARVEGSLVAETGEHVVTISASVEDVCRVARVTGLRCGYAEPVALDAIGSALTTSALVLESVLAGDSGDSGDSGGRGSGGAYGPDDVTSLAVLLESIPRARLRPFVARIIEPLVAAGGRTSPTYLETLRAFLDHDLSVGRTAKAQFLHPNTVRHRLALIKELTGRDPFVTDDALALAVALRAHDRA
ncbi:MAG: CdaR family transcriptional regulator [Humibacillus sp.]|nr:CdaR family transcriptional regulator [Humibacillus sp.]